MKIFAKERIGFGNDFLEINGGQTEIRTQERSRVAGFQDRCIQPLCHLSADLMICIIQKILFL
jgi:hypothetical protein